MKKSFWFHGHRGFATCFAILMFLLATLLPVVTGVWSIAASGNPVTPIVHSLLRDSEFRDTLGLEFVQKLSKDASGAEKDLFTKKGKEISTAVSNLLSQPEFELEVDKISNGIYSFYSTRSKKSTSIDVKPIADLTLTALTQVDKQFSILKKELSKLKPIELKPQTSGPDIARIKEILNLSFYGILTLFILVNILYFRYAKNMQGALRIAGSQFIYIGVSALAINIVGNSLIGNFAAKNSEELSKVAIPIVARHELGIFFTLGLVGVLVGLVLQVLSFTKFKESMGEVSP